MSQFNIHDFHVSKQTHRAANLGGPLAAKPALLDNTDKNGKSALFVACEEGDIAGVEQFIRNGANVNQPDNRGRTPLMVAAQNGHPEVVKRLLKADADPSIEANNGSTALHHAAAEGFLPIVEALVDQVAANSK